MDRPKKDHSLSFPYDSSSSTSFIVSRSPLLTVLSFSLSVSPRFFLLPWSRGANRIRNKTSHLEIHKTNEDLTYTVKLDLHLSTSHSAFSFPPLA